MQSKKSCEGTVYKISGKNYCVGEKIKKFKKRTKFILKKSKKNKSKKTRKQRKRNTRKDRKGGNNYDKVNCCMCGNEVDIKDSLIPQACLIKNGNKAHRICSQCWWDPVTGFAREGSPHGCPGCAKNLPLRTLPYKEPEVVDLTEDD